MAADEYDATAQPPGPDPALRRLDRFVGTWDVRGRTLDAEEDNVSGRLAFEWLTGGFFLQQRVHLNFMGVDIAALERAFRRQRRQTRRHESTPLRRAAGSKTG